MQLLFLFSAILFSVKSFSIVGDDLNLQFDPVCKVSIYSKENTDFKRSCTGTLITKDTVQTAAHCIFDKSYYEVECGQTRFDQKKAVTKEVSPGRVYYTKGLTFKEKYKVLSATKISSFFDKAILKIDRSSSLKPARLSSVSKLRTLVQKNKCYFSGFGRSNGIIGKLNSVKIATRRLLIDFESGSFTFSIPKTKPDTNIYSPTTLDDSITAGSIASGDSGSSVICVDADQVLSFGVANSTGNTKNSLYAMSVDAVFSFSSENDI